MAKKIGSKIVSLLCLTAASLLSFDNPSVAQSVADIQASHIAGNVPPASEFDVLLSRDLTAYFTSLGASHPRVTYELLRNGPTQTGIAYPKYYLWVVVVEDGGGPRTGAVRVAAIERTRFEVTHFVSRGEILEKPSLLASIFPAALIPAIQARAAAK
jgi:hypothetical protein